MGNNNSQQPPSKPVDVVRQPPSRPNAPPSARLTSELGPQGPSYKDPENQVLPMMLPSSFKLRPVSMELSKLNPDYHNIYSYENNENYNGDDKTDNNNDGEEKKGDTPEKEKLNSPPRPPPPMPNGDIPTNVSDKESKTPVAQIFPHSEKTNSQIPNGHAVTDVKNVTNNVTNNAKTPYRPSHRRQMSLTTNLTGQEHTILEEPEENIDNRVKLDPLMQSFPGATGPSLPVKNNFNLDYSYQLTYVQLAEHRRNKTIEDLEKKTGKKLSDLSDDLNSHVEEQSFFREAPSRVSTRSSGSGISSKKKRAPAPPGQAPPAPPSSVPNSPRRTAYSVNNEPPVDYEIESPRRNFILPRYSAATPVSRVVPSQTNVPPPPPAPPVFGGVTTPRKQTNLSRNNSMSSGTPEIILKRTPSIQQAPSTPEAQDGKVPWLLEIKNLSESRAARRQQSLDSSETPTIPSVDDTKQNEKKEEDTVTLQESKIKESAKTKLVFQSSENVFVPESSSVDRKDNNLENPKYATIERMNSVKPSNKPASPKLQRTHSTTTYDRPSPSNFRHQASTPSTPKTADPMRRLSSLLQHDIKSAANAKCLKLVKQTTPVLPRPKDPHTVFREQLQKACSERDDRVQTEGTIDDKLSRNLSFEDSSTLSDEKEKKISETDNKATKVNVPPQVMPKPPRYHKNVTLNRNTSAYTKGRQNSLKDNYRASASFDWTPEDDLDSDDNISDREEMTLRKGSSDGFKSTIVPSNVNDLKGKMNGKGKGKKQRGTEPVDDNKNKFGSVKKFKKSMHKSVKNAFGSISKASGKLLRKQRNEDLEVIEDAPMNWRLASNGPFIGVNGKRDSQYDYQVTNGFHDEESDSDDEKHHENDNGFSEVMFRNTSGINSGEETSENDDNDDNQKVQKNPQKIKRAGIAYYNADGQLVVLPDNEVPSVQSIESTRSIDRKKKYAIHEGTGTGRKKEKEGKKEKEAAEVDRTYEHIREKERQIEEEKRKQLEIELEMHKRREAETRDRLQRLENAHLQQQINTQLLHQQQQQQNVTMLSAPPLPPAGTFPPNYSSMQDSAQTQTFTNLFGQQLPQNGYQSNFGLYNTQTGPMMNGSIPGMSYDLNDYMRMLGVQSPPTSQQMAYFLNNMTLAGQPFERKSNPTLFEVLNQDPLKSFPNGTMNYPIVDPTLKKQGFQNWASTPNIHSTAPVGGNQVPLGDFMTSYNNYNGANTTASDKDESKTSKTRNPLYNSDDSDEGLSPKKTIARAQVQDFRQVPVRTESGKFMRRYGGDQFHVSQNNKTYSDVQKSENSEDTKSNKNLSHNGAFPQRQGSVSPSNSISTVDSAITSASVTSSPPPSPARHQTGYKTVLDLSKSEITTQIVTYEESPADH